MNEDIVERCRDLADASWQGRRGRVEKALHDAAAEIERLRVWSSDSHVTELEETL